MGCVVIIARALIMGCYGEFIFFITMALITFRARAFVKVFLRHIVSKMKMLETTFLNSTKVFKDERLSQIFRKLNVRS